MDDPAQIEVAVQEMAILQHFTETLAHQLNATTLSDSNAIPSKILQGVNQARIFHYHGHVHFDPEKPRQHALELGGGELWTVQDMFVGLHLALQHPLITIIGCNSGRESYAVGDEPLGAKTAFLQAGAASFVGTLWPISAADGRKFATEFYKSFTGPSSTEMRQKMQEEMQYLAFRGIERKDDHGGEDGWERFINLAVALQKAVVRIKSDGRTRAPYHWASFVLSGSWLFRRKCAAPVAEKDSRAESKDQFGLGGTKAMSEALTQSSERDRYRAVWKSHRDELNIRLNSIRSQVLSLNKRLLDVMKSIQDEPTQSGIDDLRETVESFQQTVTFGKSEELLLVIMTLYSRLEVDFKVYVDDLGSKRGQFFSDEEFRMAMHRAMDEMMEKLDIHHQEKLLYYECMCQLFEEMCWSKTPSFRVYRTRMDV